MSIPDKYVPKHLDKKDIIQQKNNILRSRKLYKNGKYLERPKVKSYKSKKSKHINKAMKIYTMENIKPSRELSEKTQCSIDALEKIVNKGRGAYYSSGSRPNQTAESWGIARLASAITGGNSVFYDFHLLEEGCNKKGTAYKLAKKTCKRKKRCTKYLNKTKKRHVTTAYIM